MANALAKWVEDAALVDCKKWKPILLLEVYKARTRMSHVDIVYETAILASSRCL